MSHQYQTDAHQYQKDTSERVPYAERAVFRGAAGRSSAAPDVYSEDPVHATPGECADKF